MAQSQQEVAPSGDGGLATVTESAKRGYGYVGSGAINFLKGIWLQLSRYFILLAWMVVAGLVSGAVSIVSQTAGFVAGVVVFLAIPVLWGYYDLHHRETTDE